MRKCHTTSQISLKRLENLCVLLNPIEESIQMKKILWILILICVTTIFSFSQTEEYDKGEFFVGYSAGNYIYFEEPLEHGFNVAGVYNVHKYIGIKTDLSGTYRRLEGDFSYPNPSTISRWKGTHNLYNASVGVQFKDNRRDSTFKPFGHVLVGYGKHFDKFKTACPADAECPPFNVDGQGVSLIFGGGLDIKINDRIDIRAIQLDIGGITTKNNNNNWGLGRFSSGIVFKF